MHKEATRASQPVVRREIEELAESLSKTKLPIGVPTDQHLAKHSKKNAKYSLCMKLDLVDQSTYAPQARNHPTGPTRRNGHTTISLRALSRLELVLKLVRARTTRSDNSIKDGLVIWATWPDIDSRRGCAKCIRKRVIFLTRRSRVRCEECVR